MGFLPSSGYVNTTVWMHHMDASETYKEKASCEQHKNATCLFEQILEVTPEKTAAVRPLTSHLTNHPRRAGQAGPG